MNNLFGGDNNWLLWVLLILSISSNNNCGCDTCGGNSDGILPLILILLLLGDNCLCGNGCNSCNSCSPCDSCNSCGC